LIENIILRHGVKKGHLMKRIFSLILSAVLIVSAAAFVSSAQETSIDLGETHIIPYGSLVNSIVNSRDTATYKKGVTHDGRTCVEVIPNEASTIADPITLDCWDVGNKGWDLDKYMYAIVSYKYVTTDTENAYAGKMNLSMLTNGKILTGSVAMESLENVVANKWATATFCIGSASEPKLNPDIESHMLRQIHFRPYGATSRNDLTSDDVMYIENVTLCTKNPQPDYEFTHQFYNGDVKVKGTQMPVKCVGNYPMSVPECTLTLDGAEFDGWLWSHDGKVYKPGEQAIFPEAFTSFTAQWKYKSEQKDVISLSYPSMHMNDAKATKSAIVTSVTEDGLKAIRSQIDPNREEERTFNLNGWEYAARANVDLDVYKYVQVTYKYVSDNPRNDVTLRFDITSFAPTGEKRFTGGIKTYAEEPCQIGTWAVATFDLSPMEEKFVEGASHVFRQAVIYPFGDLTTADLDPSDVMYIAQLDFFKEYPGEGSHGSYINGYADNTFKPSGTMTRAEACTIAARIAAKSDAAIPSECTTAFTDVEDDAWYKKYIAYCEAKGWLGAYSGNFEPDKNITRAEFVELIYNMGLSKDGDKSIEFSDVKQDHPRYSVIMAAAKASLVNGYDKGDGTFEFRPDNTITRAEVVKVINNALGRKVTSVTPGFRLPKVFGDIDSTHWAYYDVMEAAVAHKLKAKADDGIERWESTVGLSINDFSDGEAYVESLDELTAKRIAEIRSTPNKEVEFTGQAYYISADGNDENDGNTPETAFRTIEKLNTIKLASNDAVFFRRGDEFRTTQAIKGYSGVTYTAYGEGKKPVINGSPENAGYKEAWILTDTPNVYKYHKKMETDVGGIFMNINGSDYEAEGYKVMLTADKKTDRTSKKAWAGIASMDDRYFFHELETGDLYLRWDDGNPGELYDSIAINRGSHGLRVGGNNITVDNLEFIHFGFHGVSAPTTKNLVVTNCEFGWIGGSFQGGTYGGARYGNGIEIYGGCDYYLIDNCYVYQCYDAGITHQQSSGGTNNIIMKDVTYSNNVIEKCIYNIEYFCAVGANDTVERRMENILFKDNILRLCGYGFGQQRPDKGNDAHIRGGGANRADNYHIEGNIFDRGRSNLIYVGATYSQWLPTWKNNTFVQYYGRKAFIHGAPMVTYNFSGNAGEIVEKNIGDTECNIYFVPAQ